MVTFSPAADFQNQLIPELVWGFIAQTEYSCTIKRFMELHRAEGSQQTQIKPAENKTVMTWFCQPSAHLPNDKGVCSTWDHLFLLELIQLESELPPHFGCKNMGRRTWCASFVKVSAWKLRFLSYLWLLDKINDIYFPLWAYNNCHMPTHRKGTSRVPACSWLNATLACGARCPEQVPFNWDTDGINSGVLTLTVLWTMSQHFLVLFSSAAARGCGATATAASHGTDLIAHTPRRATWLLPAPVASAWAPPGCEWVWVQIRCPAAP